MSSPQRSLPSRRDALLFQVKANLFKARRLLVDLRHPVPRLKGGDEFVKVPVRKQHSAKLWNHQQPAEFPLTAGKVQNLRVACQWLHGLEIRKGQVFSFWKQIGRTRRSKGYTKGRELREGCLIANVGGGLCQLSNLLYQLALDSEFEIMERHAHSRVIPGSLAEQDRDATVFWNYVDLRFRVTFDCRLETVLSSNELIVRLRSLTGPGTTKMAGHAVGVPTRSAPAGDCATCGMTSCFRHPSSVSSPENQNGHSAFLLDAFWPEQQEWCQRHSRPGDHWFMPLDGRRWNKPNYLWEPSPHSERHFATRLTLVDSVRRRRLPAQGAVRQRALLRRDEALAKFYAKQLNVEARHLVISQNLLPHLHRLGVLGGRTFDVLLTRWPLTELHRRLDLAAKRHPYSSTIADFRADTAIHRAETEALDQAARVVTPHKALADYFGEKAILLNWKMPHTNIKPHARLTTQFFFPASPLARKGIYELAEAMRGVDAELLILGGASESASDPLASIPHRRASVAEMANADALVLPAWIEHEPRLALQALGSGLPVIATKACGLPAHRNLVELEEPDGSMLRECLLDIHHRDHETIALASS